MKKLFLVLLITAVLLFGCTSGGVDKSAAENGGDTNAGGAGPGADAGASGVASSSVREFAVAAKQWEFTPSTITVKKGDRVKLKVTSIDVAHGFSLPDFDVNSRLEPGQETVVEFVADKEGSFSFFCSVFCGSGHGGMRGTLIVTS